MEPDLHSGPAVVERLFLRKIENEQNNQPRMNNVRNPRWSQSHEHDYVRDAAELWAGFIMCCISHGVSFKFPEGWCVSRTPGHPPALLSSHR